jgi:myo-inositol-1(or 4)-monophosphatase
MNKKKNNHLSLLKVAIMAAKAAGNFLLKNKSIKILSNLDNDTKLDVDKKSEKIIIKKLLKYYPVLGEESGITGIFTKQTPYWIVDPLDGTVNYSRNIPINCISIALWDKEKPILGVVYDFTKNELFSGIVGYGAKLNGKKIEVSKIKQISKSIIFTGFPIEFSFKNKNIKNFIKIVQDYKKVRLIGSAALSLAYVASGRAEIYKEKNIRIWDVAAGLALVKAAGGFYIYEKLGKNFNVQASNMSIKNLI